MRTYHFWILYISIVWFNWLGTYQIKEHTTKQFESIIKTCVGESNEQLDTRN